MKLISTYIALLFLMTHHCFSDVFDTIQNTNNARASKYNAPLNNVVDQNDPMELGKLLPETTKIDCLLTKNVSTTVYATTEQKKKALQAVFSAEIIYGGSRPSYLDGVSESDAKYKHCYILEQSKLFARDYSEKVSSVSKVRMDDPKYKDLYAYSGLSEEELTGWCIEMRAQHSAGYSVRKERKVLHATTGYYVPQVSPPPAIRPEVQPHSPKGTVQQQRQNSMPSQNAYERLSESEKRKFDEAYTKSVNEQFAALDSHPPIIYKNMAGVEDLLKTLDPVAYAQLQKSKPVAPTASPSAVPFKGNWTESFKLKNGETITHTPQNVRMGSFTVGKGLTLKNSNFNGKIFNIHVVTDSTREEFVAALKRDGNL